MFPDLNPNISEQHHLIGSILRDEINDYVSPRYDLDLHTMRSSSAPPGNREQMLMDQKFMQNVQLDNEYNEYNMNGAPSPRSNAPNHMVPPQMGWDNSRMNPLNRSGEIGMYPRQRVRVNNMDPNDYMEQFNGYDDMGDIQGYGNWPEGQRGMMPPPGNWQTSRNGMYENEYIDLENNQSQEPYDQYGHNPGMMNGVNPMLFPELVQGMGNLTIQPRPMMRNPRLTRSTSGLDGFLLQQQRQNGFVNPNPIPPGQRLFMSGEYGYGGGMRNDMNYGMPMGYGRSPMQDYGYQEEVNYQKPGFNREPMSPRSRTSTNPGKLSKSSLLEEFRNSKSNKFDLIDIVGNFVEFSGDQYGSRFIQQKLETATVSDKEMVFNEIYPQCISLMTDVFGNYVIQKFFEHGTAEQKRALGNALVGNVLTLSLQMYGCRVVQKALEAIDQDQQAQLVKELEGHVLICIKDQNGNHVIQKIIERVPVSCTQFIVDTFVNQVYQLATHPYGCRVIQRILEHHGAFNSDTPTQIVRELLHCAISLVQDQYGNYVIQHVLKHGRPEDKHEIIMQLRGKIVQYSQHKFASNVIEQCVEHGNDEQRKWIIDEILQEPTALANMMKHQYANYVIQKIIEVSADDQRLRVIELIRPHISSLKKYTYGKHIINRLERINGKFSS